MPALALLFYAKLVPFPLKPSPFAISVLTGRAPHPPHRPAALGLKTNTLPSPAMWSAPTRKVLRGKPAAPDVEAVGGAINDNRPHRFRWGRICSGAEDEI